MPSSQTASACRDRTPRGVGGGGVRRSRAGLLQPLRGEADLQLGLVPQLVPWGSVTPRAGGRLYAAPVCVQRTTRRSPTVTTGRSTRLPRRGRPASAALAYSEPDRPFRSARARPQVGGSASSSWLPAVVRPPAPLLSHPVPAAELGPPEGRPSGRATAEPGLRRSYRAPHLVGCATSSKPCAETYGPERREPHAARRGSRALAGSRPDDRPRASAGGA